MEDITINRIKLAFQSIKNAIFNLQHHHELITIDQYSLDLEKNIQCPSQEFKECNQLRILSYNLWNSFFAGGPNRNHRLTHFIRNLEQESFDIIFLQELFLFGIFRYIYFFEFQRLSQELFHQGYIYQSNPLEIFPIFGQNSGLIVFSKFPIDEIQQVTFEQRRKISQKGFQYCKIKNYHFVHTHLEHAKTDLQDAQIQQIGQFIKTNNLNQKSIVLGDFNISSQQNNYPFIGQNLQNFDDIFDINTYKESYIGEQDNPLKRGYLIDHIFCSKDIKKFNNYMINFKDQQQNPISDHKGLCLILHQ